MNEDNAVFLWFLLFIPIIWMCWEDRKSPSFLELHYMNKYNCTRKEAQRILKGD